MEKNLNKYRWVCIDFGTCNSAAAIEVDGKPHVVQYGNSPYFPTIACVMPQSEILVCQEAEPFRQSMAESFKQEFKLQINEKLDLYGVQYVDIVKSIFSFLKECAKMENNGETVNAVILTVPALYTEEDPRKDVMRQAAFRTGFEKVEFLTEPYAAALHYSYVMDRKGTGISLIYDLGGGTFDATILDVAAGKSLNILGHEGGIKCGGQFFDSALYKHISISEKEKGKPLDRTRKLEDYAACKRLKEILSIKEDAAQMFSNGEYVRIDRNTFNGLIRDKVQLTLDACDSLLHTANKTWNNIKQILFVGGSTAIPCISEMLKHHLISHNAPNVKIVRNAVGVHGEYNHRFATCLGGISSKILPPPPPPEPIGILQVEGKMLQLKEGENTFGRDSCADFSFNDAYMSRKHFTITVTRDANQHCNYNLTTCSETKPTIVNNLDVLDLQSYPLTKKSLMLQDGWFIVAGKTKLIFKRK